MAESVSGPLTLSMDGSFVVDPTGSTQCSCGWADSYYDCGYGGAIDPSAAHPYDCPEATEAHAGEPCDATAPPIAFEGCCLANSGALAWCDGDVIVVADCCY